MASSIICKISFGDEIRRFTVKSDEVSYRSISRRTNEILGLGEIKYKLTYKDDEGDIITMSTDEEMAEAVALALSFTPAMLRLTVKLDATEATKPVAAEKVPPNPAGEVDDLAGLIKNIAEHIPMIMEQMPPPVKALFSVLPSCGGGYGDHGVHPGVTCDKSGMCPIVGPRYNLKGHNYDLCEAEFDKLEQAEQAKYVKIDPPIWHRGVGSMGGMGPCGMKKGPCAWKAKEVHPGVTCDRSGMNPIVGPRYNLKGHNYDLCEAEFNKLELAEQAKYVKVETPCRTGPCGMGPFGMGGWCKEDSKLDQAQTVALQSMLQSQGLSFGPIDGRFGRRTKKALQAFLSSNGYELGPVDGCLGRRSIRALQAWARDHGANPGPVDGFWGVRTTRALLHALNAPPSDEAVEALAADELVKDAMAAAFGMGTCGMPWKPKCWGKGMGGWRCGRGGAEQEKRHEGSKLAARFVSDVSIFDGTQMAPGTKFTKIWRIKNVGETAWPAGTKVLFVGGDRMDADFALPITDSSKTVQPGEEVDVAVDMMAPTEVGRYLGYWRLVGPMGRRRFGQRVWCHIQVVDPSGSAEPHDPTAVEAEISHLMARTSANVDDEDEDVDHCAAPTAAPTAAALAAVGPTASAPVPAAASSSAASSSSWDEVPDKLEPPLETKKMELTKVVEPKFEPPVEPKQAAAAAAAARAAAASPKAVSSPSSKAAAKAPVADEAPPQNEADVATELMKMGFEADDVKLVVEKNLGMMPLGQLLEECTRELVRLSEWASMLADLEEMGFGDRELNKRLMVKNDGSVKRTVKDLVADAELYM